jgi:hypothetical protein
VSPVQLIYLEWTQSGGKLAGTYNVLRLSSNHQVVPEMRILEGTRNDNTVTLSVAGAPPWKGRIHDNMLTVAIPQAGRNKTVNFAAATHDDYERAAQRFR